MPELSIFHKFISSVSIGKPTFLLITKNDCESSKKASLAYLRAKQAFKSEADFYDVSAMHLPDEFLSTRKIKSSPTLLMFRFGIEENRVVGENAWDADKAIASFVSDFMTECNGVGSEYEMFSV